MDDPPAEADGPPGSIFIQKTVTSPAVVYLVHLLNCVELDQRRTATKPTYRGQDGRQRGSGGAVLPIFDSHRRDILFAKRDLSLYLLLLLLLFFLITFILAIATVVVIIYQ